MPELLGDRVFDWTPDLIPSEVTFLQLEFFITKKSHNANITKLRVCEKLDWHPGGSPVCSPLTMLDNYE